MKSAAPAKEPLLYPPLTEALKARMRKMGHGGMIDVLDNMDEKTIKGLMRAARSGAVLTPKTAKRAA